MKLFVHSILLSLVVLAFSTISTYGQCSCKCKPDPPGGTTNCESGSIAVCGVKDGECEGYCLTIDEKGLNSLQYGARVLSLFFGYISTDDLRNNSDEAKQAIRAILRSNGEDTVDIEFKEKRVNRITVNLSFDARSKLSQAIREL